VRAGMVVDDCYELVELLGEGGFGEVWRARDLRIGRAVAVKAATPDSREELARLHREAALAGSLSHPNIVTVHDYGTGVRRKGRQFAYLVMELLPGEPLNVMLQHHGGRDRRDRGRLRDHQGRGSPT
jgi:serine/threonine protein kinase